MTEELEPEMMTEGTTMKEAVAIWREQLGGLWLDKLRSFASRGHGGYYDMISGQLTGLVESGIKDAQKYTGSELMASAFGSGAIVSLTAAMMQKPLAGMVRIGAILHSDDILNATESLLHSQYVAMMAFLVAADIALGQPRRLLEEMQAIEVAPAPPPPVISAPGVH